MRGARRQQELLVQTPGRLPQNLRPLFGAASSPRLRPSQMPSTPPTGLPPQAYHVAAWCLRLRLVTRLRRYSYIARASQEARPQMRTVRSTPTRWSTRVRSATASTRRQIFLPTLHATVACTAAGWARHAERRRSASTPSREDTLGVSRRRRHVRIEPLRSFQHQREP